MSDNTATRRTITRAEWLAEGKKRFGDDPMEWRFKCVQCGGVQTMNDFVAAGHGVAAAVTMAYFSCIGRTVKDRGCNWTLGGLLQMHTLEVQDDEGTVPVFEFADE